MSATTLTRFRSPGSDYELAYASPIVVRASGADEESLKRHKRKSGKPRAFSDETGRLSSDGRKRRSRGSSDPKPGDFHNEDLRVGGPYLCSIPVESIRIPPDHYLYPALRDSDECVDLYNQVLEILQAHNIDVDNFSFVGRRSKFNPEDAPKPTLVALATRKDVDNSWLDASKKLYDLLASKKLGEVNVEIADPMAFTAPRMSPVLKTDAIFSKWDIVLNDILKLVTSRNVRVIGCFRRGRSDETTNNPPTVVVYVDEKANQEWEGPREEVISVLSRHELPMVAVEFVKDRISRGLIETGSRLDRDVIRGPTVLGQSICPAGSRAGSGSLGGFIRLKHPTTGNWRTFAVTCCHCVIPEEKDVDANRQAQILEWREHGVPMVGDKAKTKLQVDHPSLVAMEDQLKKLAKEIETIERDPDYKLDAKLDAEGLYEQMSKKQRRNYDNRVKELADHRAFEENIKKFRDRNGQFLGFVAAASSVKPKKSVKTIKDKLPSSMDWAIILVDPKRRASNVYDKEGSYIRELPSSGPVRNFRDLYINGHRSGKSKGMYSGLQVAMLHYYVDSKSIVMRTREHCILGDTNLFSRGGDSGSWVFNKGGRLAGMVFGSNEHDKITYFTHVDDLFSDILEKTGAAGIQLL